MVGGGSRRDNGPLKIGTTNVYAALESLKKKKKSDKDSSKSKGSSKTPTKEPEKQVFWAPTPLNVTSWADVDDDDDYYATPTRQSRFGAPQTTKGATTLRRSEDDGLEIDEGDDDAEEEPEHEAEAAVPAEQEVSKATPAPLLVKDTERQLSKKELKKKGLAELDAVLAELGISTNDKNSTLKEGNAETKPVEQIDDGDKKDESKSAKKKKAKKEKSSKEAKEAQEQSDGAEINKITEEATGVELEEDAAAVDVKERIKKVASMKKKKSNKDTDSAAKAAAAEAAARSARLAAAKKKEKNHYNQQPVR
ncbi:hypothetical protein ACMD2_13456 [Ananas comosus]|uniref:Uncharacterized protein n=1 Tax=Ananas comosus TaxID=4615 RepID=A0A199VKV1_ANACO|nr:hypothetical protein ACMD2_13456 [Ananas comosus]